VCVGWGRAVRARACLGLGVSLVDFNNEMAKDPRATYLYNELSVQYQYASSEYIYLVYSYPWSFTTFLQIAS